MYKAVCGKCGKDCEVPFEPRDGRPVYCSECFEKKDGGSQAPRTFQDRGPRNPNFERKDGPRTQSDGKLEAIDHKLDRILEMLSTIRLKEEKETVAKPEEVMFVDQKKAKTSKKKVTAPKK